MEDYPSEESSEIKDHSKCNERNNERVRWIFQKGLSIGKKIMITSIVISSAPIVVPPLVAISSFGFVCSLPVGFAIVAYVCTEKLINTLLPMPPLSPLMLDDVAKSFNEKDRRVVDDIEEGYEEKERPVDTSEGEINEEDGYEEQHINSNVIHDILEGIRQGEDEIAMMKGSESDETPTSSLQAVVVSAEVGGEDESEVEQVLEEVVVFEPENRDGQNGSTEMFSGVNEEEMRRETMGLIEEIRDEENEVKRDIISIKDMAESSGTSELFVIPEDVKPIEDVDNINAPSIQQVLVKNQEGDDNVSLQVEPNPLVRENLVVHVDIEGDHTTTEIRQRNDSDWNKRGPLIFSNADVREIADGSGINLFDDELGSDQTTITVDQSYEGEPFSDEIINVNMDYHEVSIVSGIPAVKKDIQAGSNKGLVSEEKIWEQIRAMRSIVGYKEKPHSSCAEELKALYVFTGIDPPDLFEDLGDVDEKLHCLMYIVGVM